MVVEPAASAAVLRAQQAGRSFARALADARVQLDSARALAWVGVAVALLIAVEYLLVQPLRGECERWRRAARPWGVKRTGARGLERNQGGSDQSR